MTPVVDESVKERILEVESRRRIFDFIRDNPGTHMREIQRRLDLTLGNLEYHLHYLEKNEMVTVQENGYKRYYPRREVGIEDQKLLGLLRQKIPRRLLILLLEEPDQSHQELLENFDVAASTLSYHMSKLVDAEVVVKHREGRSNRYEVDEPAEVAQALITYQDSFLDDAVDGFVDTWLDFES